MTVPPLNEAILLGAMIRPQITTLWMDQKTCALGAAIEATMGLETLIEWDRQSDGVLEAMRLWPFLRQVATCHLCTRTTQLSDLVQHWNDDHKLTREAIAALVEPIEPLSAPPAVVRVEEEVEA